MGIDCPHKPNNLNKKIKKGGTMNKQDIKTFKQSLSWSMQTHNGEHLATVSFRR